MDDTYKLKPLEWVRNMTGELISFTVFGWYIVMQRDDGRWYWSHAGSAHGYWEASEGAQADAELHYRERLIDALEVICEER